MGGDDSEAAVGDNFQMAGANANFWGGSDRGFVYVSVAECIVLFFARKLSDP
jgi:hypothetical protein